MSLITPSTVATTPLTFANIDSALAVVADAAYRDNTSLISTLQAAGLTQLDLTGDGNGTYESKNAAFDAWTTVVNGQPAAVIAFRGTDDINYSLDGASAYAQSADAAYWFNTTGYYDLLSNGIKSFDNAVSALGIHQVYVTGHSLGGGAAQVYMADHANTANTNYTSVVFGSLGVSGGTTPTTTDARITDFADDADYANSIGVQTAGLTITANTTPQVSSAPDLSSILSDPASYLVYHSMSLFAADAAAYDAAKVGIPSTDVTTFFTATAYLNGLPLTVTPF